MKHKKIFLIIIAAYFLFSGIFHFIRLAFDWSIIVGDEIIPSWVSALAILFSIFLVYWILRIRDEDVRIADVEVINEEEK